jgi:hypothetical protein
MLIEALIQQTRDIRNALLQMEDYDEEAVDRADALLLRLLELRGE